MRSRIFGNTILSLFFTTLVFMAFPAEQASALRVFTCPDGSIPPNGVCPQTNPNPPKISCAIVRCASNTKCVETNNGVQCVPLTPQVSSCPAGSHFNSVTRRCENTYPYQQPVYQWPQYQPQYQPQYYSPYWQPYPYHNYYQPYYGYNYFYQSW